MRRVSVLTYIAAGLILAVANVPIAGAQEAPLNVSLVGENNSGVTGTATLTDLGGGKLRVGLHAGGTGTDPRPAHIHQGPCMSSSDMSMGAGMGMGMGAQSDAPEYALTTLVNGDSVTDLNLSLNDLLSTPHAIEVHKSTEELGFDIACADLNVPTAPPPQVQSQQQAITRNLVSENGTGVTGTVMLTDLGGGKLRVGLHAGGTGTDPRPAHIHQGPCMSSSGMSMGAGMAMGTGNQTDAPEYALTTLVNGDSVTDLNLSLNDLLSTPHAIEVHKSTEELGFDIACADLSVPTAPPPQVQPQQQAITRNLVSENGTGVTGTVMLTDLGGGKLRVDVHATGAGPDPRPAHIHPGQCTSSSEMSMGMGMDTGSQTDAPEYALTTLVNGDSVTDLNLMMKDLMATPHTIEVHKSSEELGFDIACADLFAAPTTYTVAAGDTLSDIARRVYGDGDMWPMLWDANRAVIPNPNNISSGQVLNVARP